MKPLILHLTSRHPWDDIRIFRKMCRHLAHQGHRVALVSLDGNNRQPDEYVRDGVRIIRFSRRRRARFAGLMLLFHRAVALRPAVVQAHDPDLIPVLAMLRLLGIHTIFDAHEDFVTQICARYHGQPLRKNLLRAALWGLRGLANLTASRIIAATDQVATCHPPCKTLVVNNYPITDDFADTRVALPLSRRPMRAAYVGGLANIRGIGQLVLAAGRCDSLDGLDLAGRFDDPEFKKHLERLPGWEKVTYHGHLTPDGVAGVLSRVRVGMVTLHPLPNYQDARPVKLFEYLACGLPVIHSAFPAWSAIFAGGAERIGTAVDPMDPAAIADALDLTLTDPEIDAHGEAAALLSKRYRWEPEARAYEVMIGGLLAGTGALISHSERC